MKAPFLTILFVCAALSTFAQHNLVGTWELISTTGVNADGEKFALDTTTVRETKIITPTHYILIARDVDGETQTFNRCYAGTVQIQGDQYIEMPLMSSLQIVEGVKTNFKWKIKDDLFIQQGSVIRPDGKKVDVELTFKKAKTETSYPANPAAGTWSISSSTYKTHDGNAITESLPAVRVMEIITPTHWMGISYRNGKFDNAMGGTYTMNGNTMYPVTRFSALKIPAPKKLELTVERSGDEMKVRGMSVSASGEEVTWVDHCTLMK